MFRVEDSEGRPDLRANLESKMSRRRVGSMEMAFSLLPLLATAFGQMAPSPNSLLWGPKRGERPLKVRQDLRSMQFPSGGALLGALGPRV